jgi:hypothetical protein
VTLNDPLFQQNLSYSATEDRALATAVFRGGVILATDLKVVQRAAGTNMSVDVAAGAVAVPGTDAVGQGTYLCTNTAVVNVTIGAAPSAGNTRLDLIVAEVRDGDVNAGPNNDWLISVVAGTPASTPTEPAVPDSCVQLARVTVASGTAAITNAMILDRRTFAKDFSFATSTTLPIGRTGQVAQLTNTGATVAGQSDGTWRDILSSGLVMAATSGAILGTPPSIAGTKWKVECFTQNVGFIGGSGTITIPSAITGILDFSMTPHIGSTPVALGYRPAGPPAVSTTLIPVNCWDIFTNAWLTGSVIMSITVIGW